MRILQVPEINRLGRFGNTCHFYALAKHYAERCGAQLETSHWVGEKLFKLDARPLSCSPTRQIGFPFPETFDGVAELRFSDRICYPTNYAREDFRRYFPLPDLADKFKNELVVHWRLGDFLYSDQWPQLEEQTIKAGVEAHGFKFEDAVILTEESPHWNDASPSGEPFVTDFLMMCFAQNLFVYPNSSFSGFAGMINRNNVFLPEGFKGGTTGCSWRRL